MGGQCNDDHQGLCTNGIEIDSKSLLQMRSQKMVEVSHASAGESDEDSLFLADDESDSAQEEMASREVPYIKLDKGKSGCPDGTEIMTKAQCKQAVSKLGKKGNWKLKRIWTGSRGDIPARCSVRTDGKNPRGHWNSRMSVRGRSDLAPVCQTTITTYIKLDKGKSGCPGGTEITTKAQCEQVVSK